MSPTAAAAAFDPGRLRLARQLRRLLVRELAERIDVNPSAISQYEHGHTTPSPGKLRRLALALAVPPGFFATTRTMHGVDQSGAHFRSLRSTTKRERSTAFAQALLVWDLAHILQAHIDLPAVYVPAIAADPDADVIEIDDIAWKVRQAWGIADGPVSHVVRLMERHGILVVRAALSTRRANAFSYDFGDRPVAVLGTEKANTMLSRFDAAHELGHLVMHQEAEPGDGKLESQAHAFAAGLLMPRRLVKPLLPPTFNVSEFIVFAHTWGVSIAAALYRAQALGVMSDSIYRRAVTWMSAQGYRRDETGLLGDVGPPEQPVLLQRAVTMLAEIEGRSVTETLAARHLDIDVLQELLDTTRPSLRL